MDNPYDDQFFSSISASAEQSARRVLPLAIDAVAPRTVVDVGCGTGGWLRVLSTLTECEITGLDGAYVPLDQLLIPRDRFVPTDLGRPVTLDRRFDLAMSFEVAEHLPAARAAGFVRDLTRLAPAVLFAAALPGQGGVGHINEQWQSYWIDRFAEHGYEAWDIVRPAVWHDPEVAFWYRQNTFLFVDPAVHGHRPEAAPAVADVVHPDLLDQALHPDVEPTLRQVVTQLPSALGRSLAFHANRVRASRRS